MLRIITIFCSDNLDNLGTNGANSNNGQNRVVTEEHLIMMKKYIFNQLNQLIRAVQDKNYEIYIFLSYIKKDIPLMVKLNDQVAEMIQMCHRLLSEMNTTLTMESYKELLEIKIPKIQAEFAKIEEIKKPILEEINITPDKDICIGVKVDTQYEKLGLLYFTKQQKMHSYNVEKLMDSMIRNSLQTLTKTSIIDAPLDISSIINKYDITNINSTISLYKMTIYKDASLVLKKPIHLITNDDLVKNQQLTKSVFYVPLFQTSDLSNRKNMLLMLLFSNLILEIFNIKIPFNIKEKTLTTYIAISGNNPIVIQLDPKDTISKPLQNHIQRGLKFFDETLSEKILSKISFQLIGNSPTTGNITRKNITNLLNEEPNVFMKLTPEELFTTYTGYDISNKDVLNNLLNYESKELKSANITKAFIVRLLYKLFFEISQSNALQRAVIEILTTKTEKQATK